MKNSSSDAQPDTRDRIVLSALRLFHSKGYGSTSIKDILADCGAHPGSLYHYFPTKQDVLVAVLETYATGIGPMLLQPAWQGIDDPIERVFALLARYRELLVASDCFYGCPIGSIALELHEPDPEVRELLARNFSAWKDAVRACLEQARERLPRKTDLDQLATTILALMEGGVMLARTHRTPAPFDAVVEQLRSHLDLLTKRGNK